MKPGNSSLRTGVFIKTLTKILRRWSLKVFAVEFRHVIGSDKQGQETGLS